VDLQENETATIDISGSYYLTEGTQYYVVVWSPYFPNNYDWNWFFNDPIPFTVGNWVTPPDPQFILGDVNGDTFVTIADVTALIDMLLNGDVTVEDCPAADMNEDGEVTIADVTAIIDYLLNNTTEG
jgi:hypothetical protein